MDFKKGEPPSDGPARHACIHRRNLPRLADRLPLRVLLAEENAANQKVALRLLEKLGYRVAVIANHLEAARRICSQWPRSQRPRIIATTANAIQGDREKAGLDDYISKPVRVGELIAALEKCAAPGMQAIEPRSAETLETVIEA
jgi:CheY-like chemotaxis protein